MRKAYEFLPHTADVYIAAYGSTLEEAFENAARAMLEVMTDPASVEVERRLGIKVEGFDVESLLYNWLEELLFHFDSEGLLFSEVKVKRIARENEKYILEAEVGGEAFDPNKHESRTLVKAATYHMMEVLKTDEGYVLKFVLDI